MNASTVSELKAEIPLTALDRCDRCGAQAKVHVFFNAGGELLFCGHHFRVNKTELIEKALRIRDEREPVTSYAP